jgi:hypothetical protein
MTAQIFSPKLLGGVKQQMAWNCKGTRADGESSLVVSNTAPSGLLYNQKY